MIGSTVSTRSARLAGKSLRVAIRAKASPSSVVPAPTRTASSSEFHATPQLTRLCRQASPQILRSEQLGQEARGSELAGVVLRRAGQDLGHRKEDEDRDQRDDQADRADHEHIAIDRAPRRDPPGQKEQEGRADQEPAIAHAELAVVERPEQALEQLELPAADADREPLQEDIAEPGEPGRDQDPARKRDRSGAGRRSRAAPAAAARAAPATTCHTAPAGTQGRSPRPAVAALQPLERPETVVDARTRAGSHSRPSPRSATRRRSGRAFSSCAAAARSGLSAAAR